MDLSVFLTPPRLEKLAEFQKYQLGHSVESYDGGEIDGNAFNIALLGIQEERGNLDNNGCAQGPDAIRKVLFDLKVHSSQIKIIDLGNVQAGDTRRDTLFAVRSIIETLVKNEIVPILIGGSHDLTYGVYMAFEQLEQTVNLVTIDRTLDFGKEGEENAGNYLNQVVLHQPNYLFNYANIGHQRPYVDPELLELMEKMHFDTHRLGDVKESLRKMEPAIRNADIVSIDVNVLNGALGELSSSQGPNGLNGQELCQLCWYSGMSDKLSVFGLFEYNPEFDKTGIGAALMAELIWYFIDGFRSRKNDYPFTDLSAYTKFIVPVKDGEHELVFYKSPLSDRWWMDVPYPAGKKNRYERHHLVPCDYEDYLKTNNGEIPDLWWKTYQKLT